MKKFLPALLAAVLLVPLAASAADNGEAHVHVYNETDVFAWVTVYQQRTHVFEFRS